MKYSWIIKICAILAVLIFSSKLSYPQDETDRIAAKGIEYAIKGDFSSAFNEYNQVIAVQKTQLSEKYLKFLNDVLDKKIKESTARKFFNGVKLLFEGYSSKAKTDQAIAYLKSVAEEKPANELTYYFLGLAYYHYPKSMAPKERAKWMEDFTIPYFKKTLEIDPKFALAHFWLAAAYTFSQTQGRLTKCLPVARHYNKAVELDPSIKDNKKPSLLEAKALIKVCLEEMMVAPLEKNTPGDVH